MLLACLVMLCSGCAARRAMSSWFCLRWAPFCKVICVLPMSIVCSAYASPTGAGLCSAQTTPVATAELWRHCEQRGYYTRLEAPSSAALRELGFESEVAYPSTFDPVAEHFPVPPSVQESFLFDCLEVFRGSGNWSSAHATVGLCVHDGVDIQGDRFRFLNLADDVCFHELCGLALRRAVRDWHFGPPCFSYGTLRRPRLRSKACPAGFDPDEAETSLHNRLARRVAFLCMLILSSGCFFSVEQPGSSVMFYLACFQRVIASGACVTRMCFCAFGSAFRKASQWLHNKPWLLELGQKCQCSEPHFVIEGAFTLDRIADFNARCTPDARSVFGRSPRIGESVASYSAMYPFSLMSRMASGSLAASKGSVCKPVVCTQQAKLSPLVAEECVLVRASHEDPEWIGELADSLLFKELLRYKFLRPGHINVLEARMYKTFQKYASRRHPDSRTVALLDSRVTLGAVAKGRSSSPALRRVLQGTLPYTLGSGLFSGNLHVYSGQNRSDGPSRGRPFKLRPNLFRAGSLSWKLAALSGLTRSPLRPGSPSLLLAGCVSFSCWGVTSRRIRGPDHRSLFLEAPSTCSPVSQLGPSIACRVA